MAVLLDLALIGIFGLGCFVWIDGAAKGVYGPVEELRVRSGKRWLNLEALMLLFTYVVVDT